MIVICAWCPPPLTGVPIGVQVSHGICEACMKRYFGPLLAGGTSQGELDGVQ